MRFLKKLYSFALCLAMIISCYLPLTTIKAVNNSKYDLSKILISEDRGYSAYWEKYKNEKYVSQNAEVSILKTEKNVISKNVLNRDAVVLSTNGEWCEWRVSALESGMYSCRLDYCPLMATGKTLVLSFSIDGKVPYSQAENFSLHRNWQDNITKPFKQDKNKNDLRPVQKEVLCWSEEYFIDTSGQYNDPYQFFLTAGEHIIRITTLEESIAISGITLTGINDPVTYKHYEADLPEKDLAEPFTVEAEYASQKTSPMLYPIYDRTTPATTPNHPSRIRLNTIGGENWKTVGDSISWEIDVPSDGLYEIAMRVKQDFSEGLFSYRNLYIDGQIPFKEAKEIGFPFSIDWYIKYLGNDKPLSVYLTKGRHTISMECAAGLIAPVLRGVNRVTFDLNTIYRKIIMVTGVSPDIYRDYMLDSEIPGLIDALKDCKNRLQKLSEKIQKIAGTKGTAASSIDQMIELLDDLSKNVYSIPERMSTYKSNVESLGSLLLSLGEQQLQIDKFYFLPVGSPKPEADVSFLKKFEFGTKSFFSSFVSEYSSDKGNEDDNTIQVWISTGRDQTQIIRNLIDDRFTEKTNIKVNLSIVDTGSTLIQATVSGKGPHAALCLSKETPVNLAMRGALLDLRNYGIDKIYKDFYSSAWEPYKYQNGIFAIPETQTFDMFFYRSDIFDELGLKPPQTWNDFYHILEVIQGANLAVGLQEMDSANLGVSSAISTFDKFLFQNGGTYYNDKLTATRFNEEISLSAFDRVKDLYSEYKLDRDFNFYNRFRSGEMPAAIQNYGMYNMLSQAAPEIKGLWSFSPIPGTQKPDGSIDRSESSASTGCIMLKAAKADGLDNQTATFLKWWTSAEIQGEYGKELEATMGSAARYAPANVKAFNSIPWTSVERTVIKNQWKYVKDVRQIPGNYVVTRSLTSALRLSIDNNSSARRELILFNEDINREILRKRKEFHLD